MKQRAPANSVIQRFVALTRDQSLVYARRHRWDCHCLEWPCLHPASQNYLKGSDLRERLTTWHFMLGLSVLILLSIRIILHLS